MSLILRQISMIIMHIKKFPREYFKKIHWLFQPNLCFFFFSDRVDMEYHWCSSRGILAQLCSRDRLIDNAIRKQLIANVCDGKKKYIRVTLRAHVCTRAKIKNIPS